MRETFQGKVFSTHIRNAITLAEAPTQGQDIFTMPQNLPGQRTTRRYVTNC
ncbi:MAG: ParA family protein [Odoribacter splanchnicus]